MNRQFRLSKSTVTFFLIFFVGGIFSIYQKFLSPNASLSFTSPKWHLVTSGYLFVQILLFAHQFYYENTGSRQLPLPRYWITNKIIQFLIIFGMIYSIGALLSWPPIGRLATNTLNSFWLNFPLALILIILVKILFNGGKAEKITPTDLLNALILYLGFFILAPFLAFYPDWTTIVLLLTTLLVTVFYSEIHAPKSILQAITQQDLQNIFLSVLLIGSLTFFLISSIRGMFTIPSIMDEGAYSIKGYLFTIGEYFPYQDYGPWTNKMPLSFMIPGWIQNTFGPSLLTIRMAAFLMQVGIVINLFVLGRRFFSYTGAVLAVALFALNPDLPSFYSQGNTQIVSAFLISIILVLTLGKGRSQLSLLIGNLFAGILLLARENMGPFVVFLDLYLIWENGWKKVLPSLMVGGAVFILGHAYYWPGILKVWAKWMPEELTPFLDEFRKKSGGTLMWKRDGRNTDFITSLGSLTQGISSNIANMIAAFALPWLLEPWRKLKKMDLFKPYVFLFITTIFLTIIHAVVTLNDGTCVYCFSSYLSFFMPAAIILFILSFKLITTELSKVNFSLYLILCGLIFTSQWFNSRQSIRWLTQIKISSINNLSGYQFLSDALQQNFQIPYEISKSLVPVSFGVIVFIAFLIITFWFWEKFLLKNYSAKCIYRVFLAIGIILPYLSNITFFANARPDCQSNIPADYALATQYIDKMIPNGLKIYWLGESTAILLGLENQFYPQQFNEGFSFKVGSVDDLAAKYGFWNDNLAREWSNDTDFMIVEENKMQNPILNNVDFSNFLEVGRTPLVNGCDPSAYYHIYKRIE